MSNQHASALGRLALLAFLYLSFSVTPATAQNLTQKPITTNVNYAIGGYYECLPLDYNTNPNKKYPLMIFIHGIGELGDGSPTQLARVLKHGPPQLINQGTFPDSFTVKGQTSSFIVISPQFRENYRDADVVNSLIDYCIAKYHVDETRIYLTGLSMGGGISWVYAGKSTANSKRIAAMLVISGNTNASDGGVNSIVSANLPVWIAHNDGDPVVPSSNSINWEKGLNGHSPAINPKTLLNIFHADVHDAWTKTYNPDFKPNGLNVYEWMLQYKRAGDGSSSNQPPVAEAGSDQTLTLPINSTTLTGRGTDSDGTIAKYTWKKITGPDGVVIASPGKATTDIRSLVAGTYVFRLTVTDNSGATDAADVKVVVNPAPNQAPVANAGADKTIKLPVDSVLLSGSGADVDGTVVGYQWKQLSGPATALVRSAAAAKTMVAQLTSGIYKFELTVTDDGNASGKDTVKINVHAADTVANATPQVFAGNNIRITLPKNSVTLKGTATDEDGTISAVKWTKISGPDSYRIASEASLQTEVDSLIEGVYQFQLTGTDNQQASASDTIKVTVVADTVVTPVNAPPVALAGDDQTIQLPRNYTTLNGAGTDADGTVEKYRWQKVAGPAKGFVQNPNAATATASDLVQGVYFFELMVTDNMGATKSDTLQVTVLPKVNQPPVADAGADATIQLPKDEVILNGKGTDADGFVNSYQWQQLSGPAAASLQSPGNAQTTATNLTAGTYLFALTVTDDAGATATDTMMVTVKAAIVPNQAPQVHAGNDVTLTLPVNSITVTGTATDADGTIAAVQWNKLSGPAQYNLTTPQKAKTEINNLTRGVYTFEFNATDNNGATTRDTIQITVEAAATRPMFVMHAGDDQVITLPADSVELDGVADDPYKMVQSYSWTQISGPAQSTFSNAATAHTRVTGLVEGVYLFACTAQDANNNLLSDTVQVTVKSLQHSTASVYPNPSAGVVYIDIEANTRATNTMLVVYDLSGRVVYQEQFVRSGGKMNKWLDLSKLKPGIYIIQVGTDINHTTNLKFVKQ